MARYFTLIFKSEDCTIAILVDRIITVIGFKNTGIEVISMSFSEFDVTYRTRKENFLQQIDQLIDWDSVEVIAVHSTAFSDAAECLVFSGLLPLRYC